MMKNKQSNIHSHAKYSAILIAVLITFAPLLLGGLATDHQLILGGTATVFAIALNLLKKKIQFVGALDPRIQSLILHC